MKPKRCKCGGKRKRKIGGKRRVYRRRRGGALTDYLPSLDTVGSYVPGYSTAKGYYNKANEAYETGKKLYETYEKVKPAIDILNQFSSPAISTERTNPGPPLPPLPSGGLPERKSDIEHNRKLKQEMYKKNPFLIPPPESARNIRLDQPSVNPLIKDTLLGKAITFGQKYKPISAIDRGLAKIGQRDRVRNYLNNQKLGFLVSGADTAIQHGFGKRRRRRGGAMRIV